MSRICFLGTGGAVATADRDNMSFLIESGGGTILTDCPGSVIQKIKKAGRNPFDIGAILVTHIHPDHIYGLPAFIHSLMLEDKEVRLFGSMESVDFCRELLDLFHLQDPQIKIRVDFRPLGLGQVFRPADGVEAKTLKVPHHSSSLGFHFLFEDAGKRLVYSGDAAPYPPFFKEAREVDYLIHEASAPSRFFDLYPFLQRVHTHPLILGMMCQEAGVDCLIPCHFFGEIEYDLSEVENEIRKHFTGKIILPRDLMTLEL